MEKTLKDYTKIIVETESETPVIIAEIKANSVNFADGYRVRLVPSLQKTY